MLLGNIVVGSLSCQWSQYDSVRRIKVAHLVRSEEIRSGGDLISHFYSFLTVPLSWILNKMSCTMEQ